MQWGNVPADEKAGIQDGFSGRQWGWAPQPEDAAEPCESGLSRGFVPGCRDEALHKVTRSP